MKSKILYNINMLTLTEIRAEQIYLYVPDRARKKKTNTGAQNQSQCASLIEKKLETIIVVLFYLHRACSFHFYCNSIKNLCNETFAVLMLFECLK